MIETILKELDQWINFLFSREKTDEKKVKQNLIEKKNKNTQKDLVLFRIQINQRFQYKKMLRAHEKSVM